MVLLIMKEKTGLKRPEKAPCGKCEYNFTVYCDPDHCDMYWNWKTAYKDYRDRKNKQN